MKEIILVLDNIRSTHNVGSMFRTADAAGVSKIYLLGVTPDPVDRFGRDRSDIAKVALGAEKTISWEHVDTVEELLKKLEGFQIISIAVPLLNLKIRSILGFMISENHSWLSTRPLGRSPLHQLSLKTELWT